MKLAAAPRECTGTLEYSPNQLAGYSCHKSTNLKLDETKEWYTGKTALGGRGLTTAGQPTVSLPTPKYLAENKPFTSTRARASHRNLQQNAATSGCKGKSFRKVERRIMASQRRNLDLNDLHLYQVSDRQI
jgi:hypothetical protein